MTYERPEYLAEKISPELVANYLARHPEFFQDHTELLKSLYIPHPSGEAVSLVAKQLELLRDENRKLQKQYKDLVDIGRNNDAVLRKMHTLVLALMKAHTLEEAIQSLTDMLQSNFATDFVSLNIIMDGDTDSVLPSRGMRDLAISPDNRALELFAAIIENNQPQCGYASHEQLEFLFPNYVDQVESCAIIPIQHNGFAALMSIGSRDKNRFANDAGIMFLTQMAELVGLRFSSLVDEATATQTFDAVVEQLFSDDEDNIPD